MFFVLMPFSFLSRCTPTVLAHPAASQKRTFHMLIKRTHHVLTTLKWIFSGPEGKYRIELAS
jgi:hypothetical protein